MKSRYIQRIEYITDAAALARGGETRRDRNVWRDWTL